MSLIPGWLIFLSIVVVMVMVILLYIYFTRMKKTPISDKVQVMTMMTEDSHIAPEICPQLVDSLEFSKV